MEHRAAAITGKPVARKVDDVDVGCPERDAFLQDARPLVDERENAAADDLGIVDGPRLDA